MVNTKKLLSALIVIILAVSLNTMKTSSVNAETFLSAEDVFKTLIKTIVAGDKTSYEDILGRPMNADELQHIKDIKFSPTSRIVKIDNIKILETGEESVDIGNVFYIYSRQTWHYRDGRKKTVELDLHFKKNGDRWYFIPIEGQTVLFQ